MRPTTKTVLENKLNYIRKESKIWMDKISLLGRDGGMNVEEIKKLSMNMK